MSLFEVLLRKFIESANSAKPFAVYILYTKVSQVNKYQLACL